MVQPRAQLVQLLQGLEGAERVRFDLLDLLSQWVRRHLNGKSQLLLRWLEWALALELRKDLASPRDDTRWKAREGRDVNPIGAVGAAGNHPVEETNSLAFFQHLDTLIAHARQAFCKSSPDLAD